MVSGGALDTSSPSGLMKQGEKKVNERQAVETTNKALEAMGKESVFFAENPPVGLPAFEPEEIKAGTELGRGEFGCVSEVVWIKDSPNASVPPDEAPTTKSRSAEQGPLRDGLEDTVEETGRQQFNNIRLLSDFVTDPEAARAYMHVNCFRLGKSRYAVKRLRDDLAAEDKLVAMVDLASEAKFLSSIQHSNIVKMRGTIDKPGNMSYMIILDRLYETLEEKVQEWRGRAKECRGKFGLFMKDQRKYNDLFLKRLVAVFDIARAIKYLHQNKIIFRDLKNTNVACDIRGDFRIFDFGLAKELKRADLVEEPDTYICTGLTGSRRWMAPEVVECKDYGLSADVFSFGLLFWNVMALKEPFTNLDRHQHMERVVNKGGRPSMKNVKMNEALCQLMVACWSSAPKLRPAFPEICELLKSTICAIEEIQDHDFKGLADRSGHFLNTSMVSRCDDIR